MGTSNGLLSTTLSALDNWRRNTRYPVLLYDLYVGGDPLGYAAETLANEEHRISLTWNFLSEKLSFKMVVEDFARPYGRFYQYRLDGDKTWSLAQDGQNIELGHLSIGGHSLEVRLAGAPGTTRIYHIAVYPSWLAIAELIFLFVAIGLFLWWRRYHKTTGILLAERNDIADALMEVESEQQQTQMQQEMLAEKLEPQQREAVNGVEEDKFQSANAGKLSDDAPKYDRVKINEQECADIVKRMKTYIEKEKVYENPDLKMSDLADHLHLSPSKLSQVFSLYIKENYYDFINRYRLEAFKRLVDQGETERYTLLALSAKCGFKKSSFFSTFRKVEGMTPTEYLKKMK
jgi:AraC-like DNA-binding protein